MTEPKGPPPNQGSGGRKDDHLAIAATTEFLGKYLAPRVIDVTPAEFGKAGPLPVLLVPEGMRSLDLGPVIEKLRGRPDRRKGTAKATDLASFTEHANRHKDGDSIIFADPDRDAPKLTAIFNYNLQGSDGTDMARFGDHRLVYAPDLSDEFKTWKAQDEDWMDQRQFAEFIEDRIMDITAPPDFSDAEEGEYNAFLREFSQRVGGQFASPSRMMELARGVKLTADQRVETITNLASGEGKMSFSEEHKDETGAPIKIPNLFMIVVPIFYNGAPYRIPVRLRYRLAGGKVVWAFQLYRIDRAFDSAFTGICNEATADTSIPLFLGSPEG